MAIDVNGTKVTISWTAYDKRIVGFTTARIAVVNKSYELGFDNGNGAGQFTSCYATTRTLGGTSEDVDLSGVLTDAFGTTIAATEVKAWGIRNNGTHALMVGGTGGSNWVACLDGAVTLPAGAVMAFATPDATGWTVTAGTGDLLHVVGTAADTYDIIVWAD